MYRIDVCFTTNILNIEQITSESVQESIANNRPWERLYAKQVIGTQRWYAADTGCSDIEAEQ